MFNQKTKRTHWLIIVVVATLIFAGCSIPTTTKLEDKQTPSSNPTSVKTAAENVETEPDTGQNLSQYSDERGVVSAGLTTKEQRQVQDLVAGFYDSIEDRRDRREILLNSAEELCDFDQGFQDAVDTSMLEEGGESADTAVRRAHYAAQIAHSFNSEVPKKPLGNFRSQTSDFTKYAPLFGSYNQMREKACVAHETQTNATIRDYQIAVVMFGVDAMLISTGAFYRPAFVGTRFTANKASQIGLYRLRYLCGNRCWALGMSEVHVALRGSMLGATSTVLRKSADRGVNLTREDLRVVAEEYNTDIDTLIDNSNVTMMNGTLESVSEDAVTCGEEVIRDEETSVGSDNDGLLPDDGVAAGDVISKSQDAIDDTQEFVEEC